jgi:hypothetical protein
LRRNGVCSLGDSVSRSSTATVLARFQRRQKCVAVSDRVSTFFTRERLANEANSAQASSTMGHREFRFSSFEQLGSGRFYGKIELLT